MDWGTPWQQKQNSLTYTQNVLISKTYYIDCTQTQKIVWNGLIPTDICTCFYIHFFQGMIVITLLFGVFYLVDLQNPNGKFGPQAQILSNSAVALTRHIDFQFESFSYSLSDKNV